MKCIKIIIYLMFFISYNALSQYLIPLHTSANTVNTLSNSNYKSTIIVGQNVISNSKIPNHTLHLGLLTPIVFTTSIADPVQNSNIYFSLYQNYPNPFNENTTIAFELKSSSHVKLDIFDVLGHKAKSFYNTRLNSGLYSVLFEPKGLKQGIYFYQLKVNNQIETKSMLFMK